jgi:hypothetical protein
MGYQPFTKVALKVDVPSHRLRKGEGVKSSPLMAEY